LIRTYIRDGILWGGTVGMREHAKAPQHNKSQRRSQKNDLVEQNNHIIRGQDTDCSSVDQLPLSLDYCSPPPPTEIARQMIMHNRACHIMSRCTARCAGGRARGGGWPGAAARQLSDDDAASSQSFESLIPSSGCVAATGPTPSFLWRFLLHRVHSLGQPSAFQLLVPTRSCVSSWTALRNNDAVTTIHQSVLGGGDGVVIQDKRIESK
jgi:hypothetical protein